VDDSGKVYFVISRRRARERDRLARAYARFRRRDMDLTREEAIDLAGELILAGEAGDRKAAQDRRADGARLLVGARLPRELAEAYRAQAHAQGVSLYRWAVEAFARHYARGET